MMRFLKAEGFFGNLASISTAAHHQSHLFCITREYTRQVFLRLSLVLDKSRLLLLDAHHPAFSIPSKHYHRARARTTESGYYND
jgi:hypothetical protein